MPDFERWREVETLFLQALEMKPEERDAFLLDACGDDEALMQRVLRLIRLDEDRSNYLDRGVGEWAAELLAEGGSESEVSLQGSEIGPYRVLEIIGRGGMGTVYRAERVGEGFRQEVALKILRRGVDTDDVIRRFKQERALLARLDHPGIAGLIDGGTTPDGRPYFVMEYIQGESLISFCDSRRLGIDERLELFEAICDVVQYAHRNLIVHRDLKPSNILVVERESGFQIKLLDFGIAKLLDPESREDEWTVTGKRPLTPEYAAPEQVMGGPVSTSTDIYALGLLLYELMTGARPHRLGGERRRVAWEAALLTPPTRPSTLVMELGESAVESARQRGATLEKLQRKLKGDIDLICLMALRSEPERRYPSAADMAQDIRRHRTGHTVSAQPDSAWYTTGKMLRRHQALFATICMAVVVLIGSITFYTLRLEAERDRATYEAEKTRAVQRFLVDLFGSADPDVAMGEDLTAKQILDQGRRQIAALSGQPGVQADVMLLLGSIYESLAEYDIAGRLVDEALSLDSRGLEDPDAFRVTGLLLKASLLSTQGRFHESLDTLAATRRILEGMGRRARRMFGFEAAMEESYIMEKLSRYDESERLVDSVLVQVRRDTTMQKEYLVSVLYRQSSLAYMMGQPEVTIAAAREAVAYDSAAGSPSTLTRIQLHNILGAALEEVDQMESARYEYARGAELSRSILGPEHHVTTNLLHNLATVLQPLGYTEEADSMMLEVLGIERRRLGPDHIELINTLANMGIFRREAGYLEDSRDYLREALRIARVHFVPPSYPVSAVSSELASTLSRMGEFNEAERLARDGLSQMTELLGPGASDAVEALFNLVDVLLAQDKCIEAESLLIHVRQEPDLRPESALETDEKLVETRERCRLPNTT